MELVLMSYRTLARAGLLAAMLSSAALPVHAQEADTATAPTPIPEDSVQEAMARFRTLQNRVERVQQQALSANPELQQEQAAIQAAIENAVFSADPELRTAVRERIPAIEEEAAAAQQAADSAKIQALSAEFREIMGRVEEAQVQVLEEETVQERLTAFQTTMMAEMARVDPEIQGVFSQLQALAGRLDLTLGG
jgi:chromosome segregation ATPase